MSRARLTPAERRLFAQVPSLDALPRIDYTGHPSWAAQMSDGLPAKVSLVQELTHIAPWTKTSGWDSTYTWQHLASVPLPIVEALRAIRPDITEDPERFTQWLKTWGQEFRISQRVP